MSWRTVSIASNAKLDYKMDYLVVRTQETTQRIHLSEIAVLLLESTAISLTAKLLCELNKQKVAVIFCDEKRFPYAMLSSLYGSHDTSLKYRIQSEWTDDAKRNIWAEIVRAKIKGQKAFLPISALRERELLSNYINEVQPGDVSNREGHAAKVYFNAMFGMSFTRSEENATNAALNYGYGLLLSALAREICSAGYCTQLGIFHDNRFNHFNLACDFIEPFRPFVDLLVSRLAPQKFEHDEKISIIQIFNIQVFISGKKQFMLNALSIFIKSAFDALESNNPSLLSFPSYDLSVYENNRLF